MIDQALQRNPTNTLDDGSQNSGGGPGRPVQPARICSYTDFMKCQPLNFKGTKGIVGLSRWFEKMESVFHISGSAIDNQVKGNDVGGYTQRFKELALMCTKFLFDKTEKVDKYISGIPDNIHGNVLSARPKTLDDAIELANNLMDQKLRTYAERQAEKKRKLDNNNHAQQQLLKKQNVVQAYVVGSGEKKPEVAFPSLRLDGTLNEVVSLPGNVRIKSSRSTHTSSPRPHRRQIQRISLTGFPAQSVGSSNTDVLDSPCLLVLITGTSQSRQHVITSLIHIESCKSPTMSLFDVGSSRISIFTVNTYPAQSVGSSTQIVFDSPWLASSHYTELSHTEQHGKSESDSYSLSD
ncbi:hypothetical protein Tco_1210506 [Tanacetum coccineum]